MKKIMIVLFLFLFIQSVYADKYEVQKLKFTPLRISISEDFAIPPAKSVGGIDLAFVTSEIENVYGIQTGFIGKAGQVVGFQVCLMGEADIVYGIQTGIMGVGTVRGLRVAIANFINKDDSENNTGGGISLGVFNATSKGVDNSSFYGMILGAINGVGGNTYGLQAGAINYSQNLSGVQVGAINIAGGISGVQTGAFNVADSVKGVQIGAINFARNLSGIQIGGINFAQNAYVSVLPVFNFKF